MRVTTPLNRTISLPGLWVKGIRFEGETLIIDIRRRFRRLTCPDCGTRVRGRFEEKCRRWRHLALRGHTTSLEGPIRRLRCPTCHIVVTEEVPWARPGSWFTRSFKDVVGRHVQQLSRTAVAEFTGISWSPSAASPSASSKKSSIRAGSRPSATSVSMSVNDARKLTHP